MRWNYSNRASRRGRPLADRHYNRQHVGARQFVPPGKCIVLLTEKSDAIWVTSWQYARYAKHAWAGAWVCSLFRNESEYKSSDLIAEATAATRSIWPELPAVQSVVGSVAMISFIDRQKTRPTIVRGAKVWGWTWFKAGWEVIGETKGGLLVIGLHPQNFPPAQHPIGYQPTLPFLPTSQLRSRKMSEE